MRRTDFPQGVPGQFGVASFVWDATEDGALVAGGTVLRGEIPTGSILIGGFLHVSVALAAAVNLKLDNQVLLAASATTVGYQVLTLGQLGDPTKNLVIATTARSRLTASGAIATGQFAVYLFYVNNDLGEFGQATTPTLYKRKESPQALPSEIKVASFVYNSAVDGLLPVGTSYLRGEVPPGSVVIGGYFHAGSAVPGAAAPVSFSLAGRLLLQTGGGFPAGFYGVDAMFSDPTRNFLVTTESDSRLQVTVTISPADFGQICFYLFYVTNQVGEYGNLGQRRRTESPEARPGEMRLATFTWDAVEDGPLPPAGSYLRGEVPIGSVVVGGYVHCLSTVVAPGGFTFYINGTPSPVVGGTILLNTPGNLAIGFAPLSLGVFADPTKNILANTENGSRVWIYNANGPITTGRMVLYLFYINNELGLHGQITAPHSSQIT